VPEDYFTGSIASGFKTKWPETFDAAVVDPAVDFLAGHAGAGRALELGIGTGRLALPLSRRRVLVHGIEHVATQTSYSHHFWVTDGSLETFSAPFRYVWPSELDLMARLAGMTLHERWADCDRSPFTSDSRSHISVWEKAIERPDEA